MDLAVDCSMAWFTLSFGHCFNPYIKSVPVFAATDWTLINNSIVAAVSGHYTGDFYNRLSSDTSVRLGILWIRAFVHDFRERRHELSDRLNFAVAVGKAAWFLSSAFDSLLRHSSDSIIK